MDFPIQRTEQRLESTIFSDKELVQLHRSCQKDVCQSKDYKDGWILMDRADLQLYNQLLKFSLGITDPWIAHLNLLTISFLVFVIFCSPLQSSARNSIG